MSRPITARAAAVCLLAALAQARQVSFLPLAEYDLSEANPIQSAVADFDKDGKLDVVVSTEGFGSGKVNVLFGDGAGDFGANESFNSPAAWAVGVGDFDGDTFPDLAIGTTGFASQATYIYLNDHQRGFVHSHTVYALATVPKGSATGDLDGDGVVDLAVASASGGNAVDWFHGNGDGTFGSFHSVPYTNGLSGTRVVAADLDGDGDLDLALAHTAGVKILLNTGNPNDWFHPPVTAFPLAESTQGLVAADVDADGTQDLLTISGSLLRVWRGQGNGAFALLAGPYAASMVPYDLRVADVDGDGRLDAVPVGELGFELFYGQAGGGLGAPQSVGSGTQPRTGVVGDWDGDGRVDLAAGCLNGGGDGSLAVHLQEQHPPPVVYCTTKVNSQGCFPAIHFSGAPHATGATPFEVSASYVINNKWGMLFYGYGRNAAPFMGGTLCVAPTIRRTPVQFSGGTTGPPNCSGTFAFDFNALIQSGLDPGLTVGATVDCQYWYRDPQAPQPIGLTDALEFVIAP